MTSDERGEGKRFLCFSTLACLQQTARPEPATGPRNRTTALWGPAPPPRGPHPPEAASLPVLHMHIQMGAGGGKGGKAKVT